MCMRLRGDLPGAAPVLAEAQAAAPGDPSVRLDYANVLRDLGRADEAETLYRALLIDQPGLWQALAGLGLCLRQQGDLAQAAKHLAAAVALTPGVAWPRLEYASMLPGLGQFQAAEPVYRALLAHDAGLVAGQGRSRCPRAGRSRRQRGARCGWITRTCCASRAG